MLQFILQLLYVQVMDASLSGQEIQKPSLTFSIQSKWCRCHHDSFVGLTYELSIAGYGILLWRPDREAGPALSCLHEANEGAEFKMSCSGVMRPHLPRSNPSVNTVMPFLHREGTRSPIISATCCCHMWQQNISCCSSPPLGHTSL